ALVTPGSAMLTDAGNSVGTLAADLSAGAGSLKYSQNNSLNIGSVLGVAGITAPSGTVSLSSNGGITQTAAITAANLAIKALGDVDLSTAANSVTNVAAFLGDPSNTNRNFSLTNGTASLNVGAAIDGLSGISMQLDTSGYDPANQNGRISLISGGALTQSIGALLAGKAVYAEGTSVNLSQPNPTGMIAGRATGANKGDKFSYASANGIQLTTVGANSGVSAPNVIGSVGIQLTTATNGIGQDGAAPLMTNAGVSLNAAGPVYLTAPGNSVASISAAVTGPAYDLIFTDSTPLTVASPGIATSGNLMLLAPAITISAAGGNTSLSGTTVELQANQAGGTITMSGGKGTPSITAINSAALETDNLVRNSGTITVTASAGDISVHPFTAARPITVGDTACTSSPCLLITDASLSVFNSPVLVIGNDSSGKVSDPTYTPPVSGDIFVGTAGINRGTGTGGTLALVSGGNVSQAGGITVDNLGVKAVGSVSLTGTNTVQTLADKSGTLAFSDNAPLTIGTVSGGVPPNNQSLSGVNTNGDAQITASGGLVISSPVNALSGAITLTASSGSITSLNGTGSPDVSGTSLTMSGSGGIGSLTTPLNIQVATLGAANSAGGDIAIKNTGVLTIASLSNTGTGRIWLDNTGAVTTGSSPVKADGDISITAHSPLTIAAGGVTSTSGNITLTAGATGNGATTDNLTLNGPLSGTNITLTAGNAIVENSTVTASGTVNRTANTNLPLPTIGQCIATPTLTGCSAVLPSLTACTATPTLAGCSVVLPSLATCTSSPATAGCSAVLPSLAICTSAPTTAGCSAVLPTLTQCTATPTLAGCSAVLPKLAASQPEETSQPVQQTVNNLAGQINPTITTTQPVVALIPTSLNQSSQPAATSPPSTAQGQQTGSQNPQQGQSMQSSDATPAGPSQSTATDSSSSSQGQTGTTQGQQSGDQGSQANNGQNGQGKQSDKQDEDKKGNKDTTQKTIAEKRDEIKKNKQYCN
ncbi:MAG TPA: hypothetical protein VF795_10940, partial [Desulfuromonadaceae bacterium]